MIIHFSSKSQCILFFIRANLRFNAVRNFYKSYCTKKCSKPKIVAPQEVQRFIVDCFTKLGVHKEKAIIFSECILDADYKGIYSHGLSRIEHYIKDINDKLCNPNADPEIVIESVSAAVVCGNNGIGSVVGKFCMDLAIKKAEETGISMVVAHDSNHFGLNSFYTEYAVKRGFIGLAFSNTSPLMVPTGAKKVTLGTNPLSLAAPGENEDKTVMDFATTAVSLGKIEMFKRKKLKIPLGWALDENGKPTTDPKVAIKAKKLSPLGGDVSYKGTSLGLMVEILSGILAGSNYGPYIRVWGQQPPTPANLGHGFIVINPKKFTPGFECRLSDLMSYIRKLEPVDPKRPVLIPGDMENKAKKQIEKQGGIIYTESHLKMVDRIVKTLGVKPLKFLQ